MKAISTLPAPGDIDADYAPQYVKLARIVREKIEAGEYRHGAVLPAVKLAAEYQVSKGVAFHTLGILAANRYVRRQRPDSFAPYVVTWQATT